MTKIEMHESSSLSLRSPWTDDPLQRPRLTSATACGKAIIVGEHAVVYGARAVAMPVHSLQMAVRLVPTELQVKGGEPLIRVTLGGHRVSEHLRGVIIEAFETLALPPFPLDLDGTSSVLIGAGLGSSASLCIAVLRALAGAYGLRLSPAELATYGNRLERRFHGNPSGLDSAVVAFGQVLSFARGQGSTPLTVKPLAEGQPWRFALLDSGARSSTLAMVQSAAPYFQGAAGQERIARFDELADQVISGLAQGVPELVGGAMNEAGRYLSEAGVAGPALAELMELAREEGALAAKPTGAGGGGCILVLLDPRQADQQLSRIQARVGANRVFSVELP